MNANLRTRFWISSLSAVLATLLFAATLINRSWIESLFGVEPDGGSGEAEWLLVAVFAAIAVGAGFVARREWRSARSAA